MKLQEQGASSIVVKKKKEKTIIELEGDCEILLYIPPAERNNGVIVFKEREAIRYEDK